MAETSGEIAEVSVEPKTGDKLRFTGDSERIEFPGWVERRWGRRNELTLKLNLTLKPELERQSWRSFWQGDFKEERARSGTGPGGTKSPSYSEPSAYPEEDPALILQGGAEIEVVEVKTDEDDPRDKKMIFRYISGPARIFPGGGNWDDSIPVSDIVKVDGRDIHKFFRTWEFVIPYDSNTDKFEKVLPRRQSLLGRILRKGGR